MTDTGVVHGRFQVFHLDHLKYILAAKERCRHLIVGITNPDPTLTRLDPADPYRSSPEANPLTYFERYMVVSRVLLAEGFEQGNFSVVPFPVNFPDLYRYYLPLDATFYLTIYDDWGRRKFELFKSLGLKIELLWEKPLQQKGISASDVRKRIMAGKTWEDMVPAAAADAMNSLGIPDRIRSSEH